MCLSTWKTVVRIIKACERKKTMLYTYQNMTATMGKKRKNKRASAYCMNVYELWYVCLQWIRFGMVAAKIKWMKSNSANIKNNKNSRHTCTQRTYAQFYVKSKIYSSVLEERPLTLFDFVIYDWDPINWVYGAFAREFSSIIYTEFDLYIYILDISATLHLGSIHSKSCIESNMICNSPIGYFSGASVFGLRQK